MKIPKRLQARHCTVISAESFLATAYDYCRKNPGTEQAGFWFVKPAGSNPDRIFLSGEFVAIPPNRLLTQTNQVVTPDPLCFIWACRQAKATNMVLFLLHTHPGVKEPVSFSEADEQAEIKMAPKVMALSGKDLFGAVVVGYHSYMARVWRKQGGILKFEWVDIVPE